MSENRSMVIGSLVEIEPEYFNKILKDIFYYNTNPKDKNIGVILGNYNKYNDGYFIGLVGLVNSVGDKVHFVPVDKMKKILLKAELDIIDFCENYCIVKCSEECKFYNYKNEYREIIKKTNRG